MEIRPLSFQRQFGTLSPFRRRAHEEGDPKNADFRPFRALRLAPERGEASVDSFKKSNRNEAEDNFGFGALNGIAKRGVHLAEKLARDLEHQAVQSFQDHLQTLEKLAQSLGVDLEDFRAAIRGQLDQIGATNDGNSSIDDFELAAAITKQKQISTQSSEGQFNLKAQVQESLEFNFKGDFSTKDGNTVHIEASFDLNLASEVGVQVARVGNTKGDGAAQDGEKPEFNYRELVGGFFARLKEFKAEARKKQLKEAIENEQEKKVEDLKRAKRDELKAVNATDPNSPITPEVGEVLPLGSLQGISYNYQSNSFQFDYTKVVDDKHNRAIQIYRAALLQEEVGISVVSFNV